MRKRSRHYWDSNVFIAWIKDEDLGEADRRGLAAAVHDIDQGMVLLLTSTLTLAEVLEGRLGEAEQRKLEMLFRRPNTQVLEVSLPIARLAAEIRHACREHALHAPKVADAIHIATAVLGGATELHTFDGQLLRLDSQIPGHPLRICKPRGPQAPLFQYRG